MHQTVGGPHAGDCAQKGFVVGSLIVSDIAGRSRIPLKTKAKRKGKVTGTWSPPMQAHVCFKPVDQSQSPHPGCPTQCPGCLTGCSFGSLWRAYGLGGWLEASVGGTALKILKDAGEIHQAVIFGAFSDSLISLSSSQNQRAEQRTR